MTHVEASVLEGGPICHDNDNDHLFVENNDLHENLNKILSIYEEGNCSKLFGNLKENSIDLNVFAHGDDTIVDSPTRILVRNSGPQGDNDVGLTNWVSPLKETDLYQIQAPLPSQNYGVGKEVDNNIDVSKHIGLDLKCSKVKNSLIAMECRDAKTKAETKVERVDNSLCGYLWGSTDCDWSCLPVVGKSGGTLSIWNMSVLNFVFAFIGPGSSGASLILRKTYQVMIVNVYSPCSLIDKQKLWEDVVIDKGMFACDLWCVLGDFNATCSPAESVTP
ncbi:hypothetical protein RIF29_15673 [Crotalaria pallida]|uniref:Uncharacterized protein n=1 Tax=Crotalaria pallida TaxID=3830 RepID=A0AAN9FDW4_CROPI